MRRQVRTRGGVFGPGGHGGGVFDGSQMGFGTIEQAAAGVGVGATYEQAAAGIGYEQAAAGLGFVQAGLSGAPSVVCIYMPYQCQNWDQYDAGTQQEILAQANLANSQFQSQVYMYKSEGACDGTKPGRMTGALKEKLIAAGGDASKMDPDPEVFGAAECAEWWRVFGAAPTAADATALFGTKQLGPLKVTLATVCSSKVTPPSCPKPAPPAPPPVQPPPVVVPTAPPKKSMSAAWIVGGLAAAALAAGVAVAAKKKKHGG